MPVSQAQQTARRKLFEAARRAKSSRLPPVFFLTDPKRTPNPESVVSNLPRGWGVIYRHFGAPDRDTVARRLAQISRRRGLVLLIAADPSLAIGVGADGVHWPRALLSRIRATRPGWIETASAHSRMDLVRAAATGIDGALLSSVFASDSPSAPPPMGAMRFAAMARNAPLPVYALGGVRPQNAARITQSAAGWAAVGSIVDAWS